jgi:hypothetical protein
MSQILVNVLDLRSLRPINHAMNFHRHSRLAGLLPCLLSLFVFAAPANALQSVTLAWNSTDPDVSGFFVHWGTASHNYNHGIDVKTKTATVSTLIKGTTYFFAVSAYNAAGTESPLSAEVSYTVPGRRPSGLTNLSGRTFVQTDDKEMIGGFVIEADAPKKVVLRAIGPSLASSGINNPMADPTLDLLDSTGVVVATNDDWNSSDEDLIAMGLAPTDSRESAIVATLSAGVYSTIVRGKDAEVGVALGEVYDMDPDNGRIANISARGWVGTGDDLVIGGFVLGGVDVSTVLVCAIGPSLISSGVPDALLDPTLELHDANGSLIFANNDWRSDQESQIIDSGFAPTDDREAGIEATLTPGPYSVILGGQGDSTGVALVEVYALDLDQ